jgi:hypothetical protein
VLAAAIRTVEIRRGRRGFAAKWPIIAHIDPEPPGLGSAEPGLQHRNRRIVAMDLVSGEDVPPNAFHHRIQQPSRLSHPIAQRRAVKFDTFAGVDLALAVEGKMITVLRHQQMGEQTRRGATARGWHRRCRCLGNGITPAAGIFGPNVANDLEVSRHVIQHLGHVLAEPGHASTAIGAAAGTVIGGLMHHLLACQMFGQWLTLWLVALAGRWQRFSRLILSLGVRVGIGRIFGRAGFQVLEPQFELGNLAVDPLR